MGDAPPPDDGVQEGICFLCKGRLRSKYRDMHRECEREFYNPKPKQKAPVVLAAYPPARTCPECRRLDNGPCPAKVCRFCGVPTIETTR